VRDGEDLRLYLDGVIVASGTDPSHVATGLQLVLGQLYTETVERFFIGHVDEVAIYDRALDAGEIRRHYQLLRPGTERPDKKRNSNRQLTQLPSTIEQASLMAHFPNSYSGGR
jgi:hypothetical protein